MTVLEVIQKSTEFLAKKGVESPRLQTELLLAHLLQLPRMKLYLNFERTLTPVETDALREFIKRRSRHEPLQHITGSTSFCGFEITVNRHVLIPRPETEMLAELGWQFLSTLKVQPAMALDFGTGSGCIAVVLAAKCPSAKIVATDISPEALALAKDNAARNHVTERIKFLPGDGFAALANESERGQPVREIGDANTRTNCPRSFDLIISNPPYIPSAEIAALQPEVRDFDPRVALDGGVDGLDFYRNLANEAKPLLKSGGKIMLEFGDGQADAIRNFFEMEKWIVEAVQEDYSHRQRILIAGI
ncbi:MAG: peptide chain release factor N(5)-glutamine methyltransferase [Verrucomicrobiia bacterium]